MRNPESEAACEKAARCIRGALRDSGRNTMVLLQLPACAVAPLDPQPWIKGCAKALGSGLQAAQGTSIFAYFNLWVQ